MRRRCPARRRTVRNPFARLIASTLVPYCLAIAPIVCPLRTRWVTYVGRGGFHSGSCGQLRADAAPRALRGRAARRPRPACAPWRSSGLRSRERVLRQRRAPARARPVRPTAASSRDGDDSGGAQRLRQRHAVPRGVLDDQQRRDEARDVAARLVRQLLVEVPEVRVLARAAPGAAARVPRRSCRPPAPWASRRTGRAGPSGRRSRRRWPSPGPCRSSTQPSRVMP